MLAMAAKRALIELLTPHLGYIIVCVLQHATTFCVS